MPVVSQFDINKEDELGEGGFGRVYKAKDTRKGEDDPNYIVAAKQIRLPDDESERARINRECDIMKKIPPHPNIVPCLHYEVRGTDMWLIMQYCPRNLEELCKQESLSDGVKFDLIMQIVHAIKHLHGQEKPITHRDITPRNVMVTQDDRILAIKLTDFGASREAFIKSKFKTSRAAGTPPYMSPELIAIFEQLSVPGTGPRLYDLAVDIFSAGILCATLMDARTGQLIPIAGMVTRCVRHVFK